MSEVVEFDVVVFGSGAAGLTAALTASVHGARVLLCEKDAVIGGTTATSGGSCWVPGNHPARSRGVDDPLSRVCAYLDREAGVPDSDGRRRAFLEAAPRAFAFLEQHSELRFALPDPYPDYHPEVDGAAIRGRTLQPRRQITARRGHRRSTRRGTLPGPRGRRVSKPNATLSATAC